MPRLAVVIVSYQCRALLAACLDSVRVHAVLDGVAPDIHVVDNGSTDGTPELVRSSYPEVRLWTSPRNLGFAAANNLALRALDAPYVLVLNPDTVLHPGTVERLVGLLDADPAIGMAGPALIRPDGSPDHAARRAFPTLVGAAAHFTRIGRRADAPEALAQYRAPALAEGGPVPAICGAFMLLRTRALAEVGLFDERYWMYGEDLDLCWRFWRAGWVVHHEPRVSATHVKAGSTPLPRPPHLDRAFHGAMLRFYRAHYAPERPQALNAAVYAAIGAKFTASLAHGALVRRRRRREGATALA